MASNMNKELDRRRGTSWDAFGPLKEATDYIADPKCTVTVKRILGFALDASRTPRVNALRHLHGAECET
ncbi:hypothetical protein KIN20_024772 [Parelaphostrongylus tenuis]|uniref:Uncharacterized protein n=1 Tax=Parelaphostrongylus tenuis TaxID=148309 RepID=A0AAD5MXF5_PARTN|nr:hypothetical protein KIN20_024772 [Parelaphostrongylus tenuis]